MFYSHVTIVAKSVRAPWVYNIETSQEGSKTTLLWVYLSLGNNKHKMHCHHMKFDNSWECLNPLSSSFFPPICVFLFLPIYPSVLPLPLRSCCCRNKGKMWRLVTIKKLGVLPTPLSFPLVFMLFVVCVFVLLLPSWCLCCVARMKVKGSCWQ